MNALIFNIARNIFRRGHLAWVAAAGGICLALAGCRKPAPQEPPQSPAATASGYGSRIGIAQQSSGAVCLSIANGTLPANTPVSLVTPSNPQSVADAIVTGPGPACPGVDPGDSTLSNYALRIRQGHVDDDLELIAVAGGGKFSVTPDGHVIGDLDNDAQKETFKSCTSSEGVHLTVWKGQPLSGVRLWHGYSHLDYETEPDCKDKETTP